MQFQHNICIPIYVIYVVPIVAAILTISVGLIVRKIYISRASSLSSSSSSHSNNSKQVRRDSTEPLMPKDGEKPNMYDVVTSTNNFLATVGPVSAPSPEAVENLTHEIHSKEKEIERLSAEKEEFSVFLIRDLLASQKLTEELKKEVEYLKRQLSDSDTRQIETPQRPRRAMESEEVLKLQQTVQELNAKIKALENQLKSRPVSPSLSNNNTPHPIDRDRSLSLSISSSRLLSKPHDANRLSVHAIPLSSPNSPIPSSSSSAIGIPMLNIYAEETAIEAKKRELEITKEFSNREASTPRDAISPRDTSALKWRMEKGNKLDAFDKDGYLLIHRAVLEDRWDVVKHLMQIGADMNAYDARGETALHLAVRNDNELMVDYLLLYEADPNAAGGRDKNTPMHLCAYHGYIKSAGALSKAGANIEAKNEDGYTPLRIAIDREQVDFAIWIIEKYNANVNCVDDLGETLLTYGVRINKASLIDFLLDNGANPDLADDRNLTPCMVAARAENSDIIRMLISRGAGVDAMNTDGQTSLHFAASSGSAGAAQTLLELGANVDATDARGNTPLHESCKNSKFSVSARLVANKAELNLQGGDGLTPLALAICCNDDDTVALLMSNGAN